MKPQKIDVICHCDTLGTLRPLRFRFEDPSHQVHVVQITQIVFRKPVEYAGIDAVVFLCRAVEEDASHLFELRYTVHTMKWSLQRIVY